MLLIIYSGDVVVYFYETKSQFQICRCFTWTVNAYVRACICEQWQSQIIWFISNSILAHTHTHIHKYTSIKAKHPEIIFRLQSMWEKTIWKHPLYPSSFRLSRNRTRLVTRTKQMSHTITNTDFHRNEHTTKANVIRTTQMLSLCHENLYVTLIRQSENIISGATKNLETFESNIDVDFLFSSHGLFIMIEIYQWFSTMTSKIEQDIFRWFEAIDCTVW